MTDTSIETAGLTPVEFRKGRERLPRLSAPYVPGRHSSRFWTEEQKDILRQYYPAGGIAACQAHLPAHKQSPASIYNQARKLGLYNAKGGGPKQPLDLPPDIDEQIGAAWPGLDGKKRGDVAQLADRLRVPRWWITKRAVQLGLTLPHRKEPPWTAAEEVLLRKVPLHDPARCARIFHQHGYRRSATAITVRAARLHLSRRFRDGFSAAQVAEILGLDSKTVSAMCVSGELEATRRDDNRLPQQGGSRWIVSPDDLRRYVLDTIERIDLRKVDKLAFVRLIAGPDADLQGARPTAATEPAPDSARDRFEISEHGLRLAQLEVRRIEILLQLQRIKAVLQGRLRRGRKS